jgi:purine-binding chemotaxis protein CheW
MSKREDIDKWREGVLNKLRDDVDLDFDDEIDVAVEEDSVDTGQLEVLTFSIGGEIYGVDIKCVNEILRPSPITVLPRSPAFILGVLSLRGIIMPVADLALRVGVGTFKDEKSYRIIVLKDGQEQLGFAVESVTGVVRFKPGELEKTDYTASIDPEFLMGIGYDSHKRLVALLSAAKLCDFNLD